MDAAMSREQKLALVLGFALVLIVGVLVSDHLSDASTAHVEQVMVSSADPGFGRGESVEPIAPRLIEGAPLAANDNATALERLASDVRDAVKERVEAFREEPPLAAFATRSEPNLLIMNRPQDPPLQDRPGRRYTIRAGDGLWAIAEREYGSGRLYEALAAYNGMSPAHAMQVGDTVILPTIDMLAGAVPARTALPAASAPEPGPRTPVATSTTRTYVIAKGDTLSQVVQRELGTIKRLAEVLQLNPKLDPDNVRIGDKIMLPTK